MNLLYQILKGLLGRLISYAALAAGFWLLYRAVSHPFIVWKICLGILGGASILGGLYLLVNCRRSWAPVSEKQDNTTQEETEGDSIVGSSPSNKLPP